MGFTQWLVAHGTSAQVQTPQNMSALGYYGWGLEFVQKKDTGSWVHIPIPTIVGGIHCPAIRIYFKTGETSKEGYVWIRQVHLWMGASRVAMFGPDLLAPGPDIELSLNPPILVGESALGISIDVFAGINSPSISTDSNKEVHSVRGRRSLYRIDPTRHW